MKKSERIASLVSELNPASDSPLDPRYLAYFECFNRQQYYEAHDVLEHLWLKHRDANHHFYKGLIQIAGAFVHLQKQHQHPTHHKHGRRLRPAVRLFQIGLANLESYGPRHMHLDIERVRKLCSSCVEKIVESDYTCNPWAPGHPPHISLDI